MRAAIEAANAHAGDDGIFFNIPTAGNNCDASGNCTINLGAALPDLSDGVTITGPGADKLTVKRSSVSGTPLFRIFNVTTTGTVSFSGLTIANGRVVGFNGGGIQNVNAGTVNVTNCTLSRNKALSNNSNFVGGGICNSSTGTINVTNSTLTSNSAADSGTNSPTGGGIFNAGTVNIINSMLTGNSAKTSDGTASGGAIYNAGTLNITSSTIHNNGTGPITNGPGCTVNASGGGIFNLNGTANITNCTLSVNSAFAAGSANARGGGIFNDTGTVNVTNSTLSSNYCDGFPSPGMFGGGIFNATGVVKVKSTIIALGTVKTSQGGGAIGSGPDVFGTFTSQGFNLIGQRDGSSTSFTTDPTDQTGTVAAPRDPKFETDGFGRAFPKDNGGPTLTIGLLFGSPAIDKGTSQCGTCGSTGVLTTDQRGTGFQRTFNDPAIPPATGGDNTDIGAFEVQASAPGLVANVSTRLPVGQDDNALFEGFIIQGPAGSAKKLMVRGLGPFLANFNITDFLANPTLDIFQGSNKVAMNNDWRTTQIGGLITADQSQEIATSGLAPSDDKESAVIANLAPGVTRRSCAAWETPLAQALSMPTI